MNSRNRDGNPEFENHLLSIKTEHQKMIHPNSHPTYNERHQKIIEMIDLTMDKYKRGVQSKDSSIMYLAFIVRTYFRF